MMREDVSELISAYLDGEVSDAERSSVEHLLRQNPEYRRLHDELAGIRTELQALPTRTLPADFSSRVWQRIAAQQATGTITPAVQTAPASTSTMPRTWRHRLRGYGTTHSWSLVRGTVAALVIVALGIGQMDWQGPPELSQSDPQVGPLVPQVANGDAESNGEGVTLVDQVDDPAAIQAFAKDKMSLVVDFTVTPLGQEQQVLANALGKYGIAFRGDMQIDERLEKRMLESRVLGDVKPRQELSEAAQAETKRGEAPPAAAIRDEVEIYYLETTGPQFDALIFDLQQRGDEIQRIRYDLMLGSANVGVIRQLHETSRSHLASTSPEGSRPILQAALRLKWRFSLHSDPLLGATATPLFRPEALLSQLPQAKKQAAAEPVPPAAPAAQPLATAQAPAGGAERPTCILMIVRNQKAN